MQLAVFYELIVCCISYFELCHFTDLKHCISAAIVAKNERQNQITTVDGRNSAPVHRWFIPLFRGFYTSLMALDFWTINSMKLSKLVLLEANKTDLHKFTIIPRMTADRVSINSDGDWPFVKWILYKLKWDNCFATLLLPLILTFSFKGWFNLTIKQIELAWSIERSSPNPIQWKGLAQQLGQDTIALHHWRRTGPIGTPKNHYDPIWRGWPGGKIWRRWLCLKMRDAQQPYFAHLLFQSKWMNCWLCWTGRG